MFKKLKDIPECLGNINGVDYEADINVRVKTDPKLKSDIESTKSITPGKEYHIYKITSYGDPFDVWIINDFGEEEDFGEWLFEDID